MKSFKFVLLAIYPYRYYLLGPILLSIFWALESIIRPYLMKIVIDAVSIDSLPIAVDKLYEILPYYIIMQFATPTVWRFFDWCNIKYEPALKNNIAQILSKNLLKHSYSFFQNNFTGSLANKITDVACYVPPLIYTFLVVFIGNIITISIAFYTLLNIHIWFGFGFLIWVTLFITASLFFTKKSKKLSKISAEATTKITGHIVDFLGNISSVRLFGNHKKELSILGDVQKDYLVAAQRRRFFLMKFYSVQGFIFAIYQIICIIMLIKLFAIGKVTAGDFAMILGLNVSMIDNLWEFSDEMRTFSENWGIVDQALNTIYQPIDIEDKEESTDFKIDKGEIIFDNVHFNYKNSDTLFKNKNVIIKSGEKIGLVGYSGSGKSTFVNLILRLFEINSGSILIDNQDIRNVTQKSLRKYIAIIPQDLSLFNRSIMENIRYGNEYATDEEVINAAKKSYAHDFIQKLDHNYHTLAGERGVKLSGGQRQRIAIARAVLKDAPILILDEATSQLDTVTEKNIQEILYNLMKDRTTLVIAHRLSTLSYMDRILVFDNGEIIQEGSHDSLINQDGLYKKLWNTQIEGFIND